MQVSWYGALLYAMKEVHTIQAAYYGADATALT